MIEYIAELFGFAIVVFVLARYVRPVLTRGMAQRQEEIRRQLDEAEEARRRLAAAREEYERALAEARVEGERLQRSAKQQADSIVVEMREQAEAEARRIVEQAHQQIDADRQQTLNQLRATVGRLTAGLAERIVNESMKDAGRQARVVDRFLDDIEERARTARGSEAARTQAGAGR
ncbi:MAG TPA: F0F1 ATP synthase subunit B [Streptosporangiaceae bacterium]